MVTQKVRVVGGGLAGSEAACFLARNGVEVILHEMRPKLMTPAHHSDKFAELVCSNSLKSKVVGSAPGILKTEMAMMGSLILEAAATAEVPGGDALSVDRNIFSDYITKKIKSFTNIQIETGEFRAPREGEITLLATGPLTSEALGEWIRLTSGQTDLYFYDAIAPIVDAESIDRSKVFIANRYGKGGEAAYINCPMTKDEYETFYNALITGERVPPKSFEKEILFQGCQPIESIAKTGKESLRFGPMKPVGLENPEDQTRYHAVVQLRPENKSLSAYNIVGFQTKLKYGEQQRVFRLIPGLEKAEFLRLGSIHRNTYICSPKLLRPNLSLKGHPNVFFAGQITGVEGYVESAAIGLLTGMMLLQKIRGIPHSMPPSNTAMGALVKYLLTTDPEHFQPTNIHFGLFEHHFFENISGKGKDEIRSGIATQCAKNFRKWWSKNDPSPASAEKIQQLRAHFTI